MADKKTRVFAHLHRDTERVIFYLCALAAQQAEHHRLPVSPLPPAGSFDNGGGGSRDLGITAGAQCVWVSAASV